MKATHEIQLKHLKAILATSMACPASLISFENFSAKTGFIHLKSFMSLNFRFDDIF